MNFRVGISWDRTVVRWDVHDVTDRVVSVTADRGFKYDPLFGFMEGSASIRLVNDDHYLNDLLDVNLPIVIQLLCCGEWKSIWTGTVSSYDMDTGAASTFASITARDGVSDITELEIPTIAYEDMTPVEIIKELMAGYTPPNFGVFTLGKSKLGYDTKLGGPYFGEETASTAVLTLFVPEASYDILNPTRQNAEKSSKASPAIQDLLDIDGSIIFLDGEGTPYIHSFASIYQDVIAAVSWNLGDRANSSKFRSIDLSKIITRATVSYKDKQPVVGATMGHTEGVSVSNGVSTDINVSVSDGMYPVSNFAVSVTPSTGMVASVILSGDAFVVSVLNNSGSDVTLSDVTVTGNGYNIQDAPAYSKVNAPGQLDYGTQDKRVTSAAVETAIQAQSIANRILTQYTGNQKRIASMTLGKRFEDDIYAFELADVIKLTEDATNVDDIPHMITSISYSLKPNDVSCVVELAPLSPKSWILGISTLGETTYV